MARVQSQGGFRLVTSQGSGDSGMNGWSEEIASTQLTTAVYLPVITSSPMRRERCRFHSARGYLVQPHLQVGGAP